jgi:hypothetical protein
VVALLDWPICQPGLTRDLRCCIRQLALGERVETVSSEDHLALSPVRQTAIHQSFSPLRERSPNLGSESCLGKLRLFAPHELSIEPGGTRGNDPKSSSARRLTPLVAPAGRAKARLFEVYGYAFFARKPK